MSSEGPGSWYTGLPMVRVTDIVKMQNRITALEEWCDHLETLVLKQRKRLDVLIGQSTVDNVPRETEGQEPLWRTQADTGE